LFHSLVHLRASALSSVTLRCAERRNLRVLTAAQAVWPLAGRPDLLAEHVSARVPPWAPAR